MAPKTQPPNLGVAPRHLLSLGCKAENISWSKMAKYLFGMLLYRISFIFWMVELFHGSGWRNFWGLNMMNQAWTNSSLFLIVHSCKLTNRHGTSTILRRVNGGLLSTNIFFLWITRRKKRPEFSHFPGPTPKTGKKRHTRWFKVTFWSPSWRSLNLSKRVTNHHPKKGTSRIARIEFPGNSASLWPL